MSTTTETKVALITGANRGLGFETARELGEKGIQVVLGSRDLEKGKKAAAKLADMAIKADVIKLDPTVSADCQAAYDYLDKKYGKLDILVNNAGISTKSATCSIPAEDLRAIFDTNFFAVISLTQALLPLIRKAPAGRIVNLSSILASLTFHTDPKSHIYNAKNLAYDASKTALNAYTVHLAHELRDTKIKVNSAHPGWVKTDMGGPLAPMEVGEGGKTSVLLATIPEDGPTGGFFHLDKPFPW
jgi:NAD(P)-dependent dehydrogenase (short-subunit alcohol dehydrogenase family)